jgi:RimJ/RimL family protein N-acetyltransferase
MPPNPANHLMPSVSLRSVTPADLSTIFEMQLDPESNAMAGTKPFTREVFDARWEKILSDPNVIPRIIQDDTAIVGLISIFQRDGLDMTGYWIHRAHWGRGIASRALAILLQEFARRPIYASAATANAASIRILTKCGFRLTGKTTEPATDRYTAGEVAAFILESPHVQT